MAQRHTPRNWSAGRRIWFGALAGLAGLLDCSVVRADQPVVVVDWSKTGDHIRLKLQAPGPEMAPTVAAFIRGVRQERTSGEISIQRPGVKWWWPDSFADVLRVRFDAEKAWSGAEFGPLSPSAIAYLRDTEKLILAGMRNGKSEQDATYDAVQNDRPRLEKVVAPVKLVFGEEASSRLPAQARSMAELAGRGCVVELRFWRAGCTGLPLSEAATAAFCDAVQREIDPAPPSASCAVVGGRALLEFSMSRWQLTKSVMASTFRRKLLSIAEAAFTTGGVDALRVTATAKIVDKIGRESEEQWAWAEFSAETFKGAVWNRINPDDMPDLAKRKYIP